MRDESMEFKNSRVKVSATFNCWLKLAFTQSESLLRLQGL